MRRIGVGKDLFCQARGPTAGLTRVTGYELVSFRVSDQNWHPRKCVRCNWCGGNRRHPRKWFRGQVQVPKAVWSGSIAAKDYLVGKRDGYHVGSESGCAAVIT
jgi:hypothetical protein